MMQRQKLKPIGKPGYEGRMETQPAIVDCTYVRGERIAVVKNTREGPISYMYARGHIDDAQRMAGEWFRSTYERTRMGSMAVDPSHEPVDTSGRVDPIPDRAIVAIEELTKVRTVLGRTNYATVELICGQGWNLYDVGVMTGAGRNKISRILREALDKLAEMRGYATRSSK